MSADKRGAGLRRAGSVAILCGVVFATGCQVAPSAAASPVSDWGTKAEGPAAEIRNGMERLYSDMNGNDLNGAKGVCRQLQNSAQRLRGMLPAPTGVLNSEVSLGVGGLIAAAKQCDSVGATPNKGEVSSVKRDFDLAMIHLQNAQSIIEAG